MVYPSDICEKCTTVQDLLNGRNFDDEYLYLDKFVKYLLDIFLDILWIFIYELILLLKMQKCEYIIGIFKSKKNEDYVKYSIYCMDYLLLPPFPNVFFSKQNSQKNDKNTGNKILL